MARGQAAHPQIMIVSICPDCLNVCRDILKKKIKPSAESGRYRISSSRQDPVEPRCCSFCDTPQHIVHKLIGSPPGRTRTYICDKCVAAGARTIEKNTGHIGSRKNFWHWFKGKFGIHHSQARQTN
jgi:ATP-dependent protease Clp ATPase subunit